MIILDRYIGINVAKACLLVMLILIALIVFLDFVEQLDDLGEGNYQLGQVAAFVGLMMPGRMLDLVPVTALLGSSIALGGLANGSELIAMRAAGISIWQIGLSVMKTGALLMLLVAALAEFVVPPLQQLAYEQKSAAISSTRSMRTEHGFWSRDGLRFINIHSIVHGRIPTDIDIYEFDDTGRLLVFTHAKSADTSHREHWILQDVRQKIFDGKELITTSYPNRAWDAFLTKEQIRLLEPPIDSLSPSDLYYYIHYLRNSKQQTEPYELALWQKLIMPFSTGVMILLSIPFVFGLPRVNSLGQRILLGSIVGIAFYLLNQIFMNLGVLLDLSAPVAVLTPVVILLGLVGILFRRVF
jgi:lipopolysaccharide export system permease protein